MNCKPGDLAFIIKDGVGLPVAGRIVEVLYLMPKNDFALPDGYWHVGDNGALPSWVIKFQGSNVTVPTTTISRLTSYACVGDRFLRPISGISDTDDIDIEQPIKQTDQVPA